MDQIQTPCYLAWKGPVSDTGISGAEWTSFRTHVIWRGMDQFQTGISGAEWTSFRTHVIWRGMDQFQRLG